MGAPAYVAPPYGSPRRGMAITSLVLGILSIPSLGCLGIGAIAGVVLGIVALVKASRYPDEYGGKGMAVAGIATSALALVVMPFIIGIVAAIAIPSLLRARVSANEAAAIGDIRTVISAQAAYQTVNGGSYDANIECLHTPSNCIRSYPPNGPTFIDASLASLETKSGYRRRLFPGVAPDLTGGGALSPSSIGSYAYVAVPVTRGQTGVRGFCGDSSGVICYTSDGRTPEVRPDGSCDPTSCQLLQ